MERMTQEDGTRSFVRLEVVGDGDPKVPCCLVGGHGEVEDVLGDGAIEPAADGTVGLVPCISARIRGRGAVDVAKEAELAAHGLEEAAPLGVIGGAEFQLDRDVRLDGDGGVRSHGDRRRLGVVDEEGGDAVEERVTVVEGVTVVGDTGHQQIVADAIC